MIQRITLLFLTSLFLSTSFAQVDTFALVGYATINGNTTGGEGGTTVTVSTGTELQESIKNKGNQPLTIFIDGVITPQNSAGLSKIDIKDVDDISVLGLGNGAEFNGIGIKIWRASNIILRNLKIHHVDIGDKDCISIEGPSDHIWVDHCELYNEYQTVGKDDYDGLFDIKRSTDFVTFSWNYLHDSWKCSLSGSSESDTFNRHVSYHHNIYENANSRMPLFRGGTGHIFNNYYVDVVSTAINSRINACIRIENNYFQNVQNPWVSAYSDILGAVDTIGNVRINSPFNYSGSDTHQPLSCSLTPPYSYADQLFDANDLPAILRRNAGVGKLFITNWPTQIDPVFATEMHFWPNPVNDKLQVAFTLKESSEVSLQLVDLTGKVLFTEEASLLPAGHHRQQCDVKNMEAGCYLLVMKAGEERLVKKVVVGGH